MTNSIWGWGLRSRYYWGRRIALRRNLFVYEIALRLGRTNLTFLLYRKQPTPS